MASPALNLIVIRSSDLARARLFYESLGIVFESERHGSGPEHFAGKLGEVVLEIYPSKGDTDPAAVRLGFVVDRLDHAILAATHAGGTVVSAAMVSAWGRRAVLSDPDGRRVELVERRKAEVTP